MLCFPFASSLAASDYIPPLSLEVKSFPRKISSEPPGTPASLVANSSMSFKWIIDKNERISPLRLAELEHRPRSGRSSKKSFTGRAGYAVCFRDDSPAPSPSVAETSLSCTTFNILAPIYKRLGSEACRESDFREFWLSRNHRILERLLFSGSSVICLQEFWLGNEELVRLYEDTLARYQTYKLARTNGRGDGLLTAINIERLQVLNYKELLFHDCGDRVAQIFHLRFREPFSKRGHIAEQEFLLVNTHLLFPHDSKYCLIRLRQVYKILECLEQFKIEHSMASTTVILCGDWNGSKRGHVYKFLRSQGFVSSYDSAHRYSDSDAHQWVSHRNHRGNLCGVDFIWFLNPSKSQKPLSTSWKEAVLSIIKAKLFEAGLKERDAFCFFQLQENGDIVTFTQFQRALQLLGLTETDLEGLTKGEMEDLMKTLDIDGNGLIDYSEFEGVFSVETNISEARKILVNFSKLKEQMRRMNVPETASVSSPASMVTNVATRKEDVPWNLQRQMGNCISDSVAGFAVHNAFLFPPEVEKGFWPEDYSLSDHAPLTAIFTPLRENDV